MSETLLMGSLLIVGDRIGITDGVVTGLVVAVMAAWIGLWTFALRRRHWNERPNVPTLER